ncbi:inositol 1,4,5-triphosphate receptor associated 2-like isoform X2 [Oncorhynchus keta]|uniref:inositol 1,4,5-triphosphate receptor associated 2-like isoform X2 n=1 Tax=Oncorhynchus keta TaxID=8018 RepID=UPI0015F8AE14|nr:inositol 1,4,5-triphosphate receptor associated 2-like isoform X2 [Oncorhynchus keta]
MTLNQITFPLLGAGEQNRAVRKVGSCIFRRASTVLTLHTTLPNTGTMSAQPPAKEAAPCEYAGILGDSSESDQEPSPEDQLAASWENLPILERLGLSIGTEMTEEEVEYTLAQRLQAEEHDRTVAQANLNLELESARDTLRSLRGRCVDAERSEMLSCIEASLGTVLDGVSDIIATAEMLGVVHQEARVCCSVEIMEVHVEHLKRQHAVESAELLETRKRLHRSRGRNHSDSEEGDVRNRFVRRDSLQTLTRRRVSVTLIPTGSQLSDLETKFQEGCRAGADTDSQGPEVGSVNQASSSLQMTLRHRRRSAVLEREAEAEGSGVESATGSRAGSIVGTAEPSELSMAESVFTSEPQVVLSEQNPQASWLSYCLWVLVVLLLLALSFFILLGFLLWGLRVPHHSPSF